MRRRRLIALRIFLVLLAFFCVWRLTLSMMVQAKLDEIRKQGYPVTAAELDRWYQKPPIEKDATESYLKAFTLFSDKYHRWHGPGPKEDKFIALLSQPKIPQRGGRLPGEMKKAIATCLSDNSKSLEMLHKVPANAKCRFPHDLTEGWLATTPNLGYVRHSARLLTLEAISRADEGDREGATKALIISLGLSQALGAEPLLISQLVRNASLMVTLPGMKYVIERGELSDRQLVDFSSSLGNVMDETADAENLKRGFVGERCLASDFLSRSARTQYDMLMRGAEDRPWTWKRRIFWTVYLYRFTGMNDIYHLKYLDTYNRLLTMSQLTLPDRFKKSKALDKIRDSGKEPDVWTPGPANFGFITRDTRWVAMARCIQTSLAVERYRSAKKKLPNDLQDLVPQYLPKLPADPFDGKPLRFRKTGNSYVVYSVSWNEKDDGGDDSETQYVEPDVVFRIDH